MTRNLALGLVTACSLMIGISTSHAAISLTNGSFEAPALGVWQTGFANSSWEAVLANTDAGGMVKENIAGFELVNNGKAPDGSQWAFLREGSYIYQAIGSLDAGQQLHFSLTQYMQANIGNTGSGLSVEIWSGNPTAGGSILDAATFGGLAPTAKALREATLNPGGSINDLHFVVRAVTGVGEHNVSIDNIVLSAVVPEPASLALLGMGGLLLLRRRRITRR